MALLYSNLCSFLNMCFWHYSVALAVALIWFCLYGCKKNPLLTLFVAGFLFTFAVRLPLHLNSARYMFNPVLLALPVIAIVAVELCDRGRGIRWSKYLLVSAVAVFTICSFLKFSRQSRNPRDGAVMRSAELVKTDFAASGVPEALLVSNGDNIGLTFIYSGIPGKFYQLPFDPADPHRFASQLQLLCSQYPLVYLLKEQRRKKTPDDKSIFSLRTESVHSYRAVGIDRGSIDPGQKYGKFELLRISSVCPADHDPERIAGFVGSPPQRLANGSFSRWDDAVPVAVDPQLGGRPFAQGAKLLMPANWSVDSFNRRGGDFTAWSCRENPPSQGGGVRIDAPRGGLALKNRQEFPVGNYSIDMAVSATPGGKLLAILYIYKNDKSYLSSQSAGVYQFADAGNAVVSIPVKKGSFPAGAAFFRLGIIGWQGNFSISRIELSAEGRHEK